MTLFKRALAIALSISLTILPLGGTQAAMVSNQQIIDKTYQINDKQTLLQTLNREEVQQQLISMGVNAADIESRISQMTQEELAQLNQQMTVLPAGADGLGLVVLVLLVFVITDMLGATDIYPFVHPIR
jgi:hypothetical protein